jgi:hypothetical protein
MFRIFTINFESHCLCRRYHCVFLVDLFVSMPFLHINPTEEYQPSWLSSLTRSLESAAAVSCDRFLFVSGYPDTKALRQTALFYAARQGHADTIRQG